MARLQDFRHLVLKDHFLELFRVRLHDCKVLGILYYMTIFTPLDVWGIRDPRSLCNQSLLTLGDAVNIQQVTFNLAGSLPASKYSCVEMETQFNVSNATGS